MEKFLIQKSNGEIVPFDEQKLLHALMRSGARQDEAEKVLADVRKILTDGISTRKIYQYAYRSLRRRSQKAAGRYRLKKAMMDLGPSGYPFEKFVAKLLEAQGYECRVNIIQEGKCISHELDVVAVKGNVRFMIECKYHSGTGKKSDVKVPLYIRSRFQDVKAVWENQYPEENYYAMVVTNTRFTDDALQYARCAGMKAVSWDYPEGNSLKNQIDKTGLHPITTLGTLRKSEKQELMNQGIVLCRELIAQKDILNLMHIHQPRINSIINEAREIIAG